MANHMWICPTTSCPFVDKLDLGDKLIEYIENGLLGAVVFDEGIHPEFVLPLSEKPDNKIPTPAKSFIKSFKTWLKS